MEDYRCIHVTKILRNDCKIDSLIMHEFHKYYLKHEKECFIRYKTRGAAERFTSDKTRQRVFWIA
jgi:hypothetical protein